MSLLCLAQYLTVLDSYYLPTSLHVYISLPSLSHRSPPSLIPDRWWVLGSIKLGHRLPPFLRRSSGPKVRTWHWPVPVTQAVLSTSSGCCYSSSLESSSPLFSPCLPIPLPLHQRAFTIALRPLVTGPARYHFLRYTGGVLVEFISASLPKIWGPPLHGFGHCSGDAIPLKISSPRA